MRRPEQELAAAIGQDRRRISALERTASGERRSPTRGRWHYPTFENGWGDYSSGWSKPAFALDNDGVVHLKGMTSGTNNGTVMFTLPESCRPEKFHLVPFICSVGDGGYLQIAPSGTVLVQNYTGTLSQWSAIPTTSFPLKAYPKGCGTMGKRQGWSVPRQTAANDGDYNNVWARMTPSGTAMASGLQDDLQTTLPSSGQIIHDFPHEIAAAQCYYPTGVVGRNSSGGGWGPRRHAVHGNCMIYMGSWNDGGDWLSYSGAVWPTMEIEETRERMTMSGSHSAYGEPYPLYIEIRVDKMGRRHLSFMLSGSVATGTVLGNLTPEHTPNVNEMFSVPTSLGTYAKVVLYTNGEITINQGNTATWVGGHHTYWLDND